MKIHYLDKCICNYAYILKAKKVGGFSFSVQNYWRIKCVNLDDKIGIKKCMNHESFRNLSTRGNIFEKIRCKSAFYLRFRQAMAEYI